MTDVDVVVVGAGVAGLAASALLRAAGRRCAVLEASGRLGGRAWTATPAALAGAPFDHGATWLHNADDNPLLPLARADGAALVDSAAAAAGRTWIGERWADAAELAAYDAAWPRFAATVAAALADGGSSSLAEAAASMRDDPWAATVAFWEGAIIAAADAHALDARDWQCNQLTGRNLMIRGGLGALVSRRLAPPAGTVTLATPVRRIAWGGRGVTVATSRGTLTAAACIVTVSTGVLRSGAIDFAPALPVSVQDALAALPMGSVVKVALPAGGADRLDLPDHCSVDRRLARADAPAMIFMAWPLGMDHVIGYAGGGTARALGAAGAAAASAFARDELRRLFGARADRALVADSAVVTGWDADPFIRGAYAYAVPGAAAARAALAEPLAGGRLLFAGEACHGGLAGTVGGAYLSGQAAARSVLARRQAA